MRKQRSLQAIVGSLEFLSENFRNYIKYELSPWLLRCDIEHIYISRHRVYIQQETNFKSKRIHNSDIPISYPI